MSSFENFQKFTMDLFLEEVTSRMKNKRIRTYCDILFAYPNAFDALPRILDYYSDRRRSRWTVTISQCAEKDFYIVSFFPKETTSKQKPVFFFWKILRDDHYVTILSFSLHSFGEIRKSLDSLVRFVRGFWFAWIGSQFLINLDSFVEQELGPETQVLASFQTVVGEDKSRTRKMRVYPLPPRQFVPLEEIRKWTRESYFEKSEILTFTNMRYRIVSRQNGMQFTFSMTNRSRITFERGDFTLFVALLRPLFLETRRVLNILRRKSYTTKSESTVMGKSIEIRSFDLIESLVFKKPKGQEKWYDNVVSLFSADIPQERLVSFVLMSGNPYFLVHIIDIENSSSVYLSATSEELQLVPAGISTKEGTITKIVDLLQTKVDPSISI